jgi:hypothetical protein
VNEDEGEGIGLMGFIHIETSSNCFKWGRRGPWEGDGEGELTNRSLFGVIPMNPPYTMNIF